MGKKTNFGLDFDPFGQNLDLKYFFREFYLCQMLEVVASYHCIQFQEKLMIQTQENGKKLYFTPDLGPLGPNSGHQFFL